MGSFPTRFRVEPQPETVNDIETDILIVPLWQLGTADDSEMEPDPTIDEGPMGKPINERVEWNVIHKSLSDGLETYPWLTLTQEKFAGACGEIKIFKTWPQCGVKARWIVFLGLGKPKKIDMNKAVKAFKKALKETFGFHQVHQATVLLPTGEAKLSSAQLAQAIVFAAVNATYKTAEASEKKLHKLDEVVVLQPENIDAADTVETARLMAEAQSFTQDLANKPANLKRAETLAEAARSMADIEGIHVEIIDDLKTIQTGMPAFWAVAQGAAEVDPPRFITVRYTPEGPIKRKLALVGKGVIFDTGGVQVKPGDHMNDMKFDMTGAASVLAAVKAAALLKLPNVEVTAYVAATANLTGETAYLPDSIIETASGKKIEIRHTDAEGRVTLADAVHKATLDKPDEIVTIATLTGSASVAVGAAIALMATDDGLRSRVETAARQVGETVQALDVLEMDYDNIKSDRDAADLSNTGKGRSRGHLTAAAFVMTFAGDIPCAHLDIAGGDAKDGNATGIAVKGLIEYLRRESMSC